MQGRDMVLVLRVSMVKTRLPEVESSFFAGLLPMLQSYKPDEQRALEIIGGSDQHPHAQLPLIYPGTFGAITRWIYQNIYVITTKRRCGVSRFIATGPVYDSAAGERSSRGQVVCFSRDISSA